MVRTDMPGDFEPSQRGRGQPVAAGDDRYEAIGVATTGVRRAGYRGDASEDRLASERESIAARNSIGMIEEAS